MLSLMPFFLIKLCIKTVSNPGHCRVDVSMCLWNTSIFPPLYFASSLGIMTIMTVFYLNGTSQHSFRFPFVRPSVATMTIVSSSCGEGGLTCKVGAEVTCPSRSLHGRVSGSLGNGIVTAGQLQ